MKTRDEIVDAVEKRIRQMDCCLSILKTHNLEFGVSLSNYEAVKEELETLIKWIRD